MGFAVMGGDVCQGLRSICFPTATLVGWEHVCNRLSAGSMQVNNEVMHACVARQVAEPMPLPIAPAFPPDAQCHGLLC